MMLQFDNSGILRRKNLEMIFTFCYILFCSVRIVYNEHAFLIPSGKNVVKLFSFKKEVPPYTLLLLSCISLVQLRATP